MLQKVTSKRVARKLPSSAKALRSPAPEASTNPPTIVLPKAHAVYGFHPYGTPGHELERQSMATLDDLHAKSVEVLRPWSKPGDITTAEETFYEGILACQNAIFRAATSKRATDASELSRQLDLILRHEDFNVGDGTVEWMGTDILSLLASAAKDIAAPAKPKDRAAHPDRALLEHCTDYAMQIAGALGAYDIDPTDGNDFAAQIDSMCRSRAAPSLAKATRARAKTVDGLRAKAETVRLILKNTAGGDLLEKEEVAFLVSHLDDVKRFHRATTYGTSSYKFEQEA